MPGLDAPDRRLFQLHAYTSVWRLRADAWTSLADVTKRLADALTPTDLRPGLQARITELVLLLDPLETYWAYPVVADCNSIGALCDTGDYESAMRLTDTVSVSCPADASPTGRPGFQVLVVDDVPTPEADALREEIRRLRRPEDPFIYELVFVPSFEDALVAVLLNSEVQACVIRPGFAVTSPHNLADLARFIENVDLLAVQPLSTDERCCSSASRSPSGVPRSTSTWSAGRPSSRSLARLTRRFRRIFDRQDLLELHLTILQGVTERYEMPFFTALRGYSRQPTGVFHALPISRGNSVVNSPWIPEMSDFYGLNIFLAETSATSGGLDSLLDPSGPIKKAQRLAARAFGAEQTFFVTNGTSTANKIVVQSIITPGDVVLVDRNCHKSHHYALVLGRREGDLPGLLPAGPVLDVRGSPPGDYHPMPAGVPPARTTRPGQDAVPDQLHLRRHRLRRRAGHARNAWRSNRIWSSCGTRRGLPSPASTRSTGGGRRWPPRAGCSSATAVPSTPRNTPQPRRQVDSTRLARCRTPTRSGSGCTPPSPPTRP